MKAQKSAMPRIPLGPALRRYFCEYLVSQRDLSARTIGSYRDTFRLLLGFLERRYRIKPDVVCVDDLDAPRILTFLDDLERRRGSTARTRNARRVAIRSFLRYAAADDPLLLPVAQRVLAIPAKRFERASVGYLTREQIQAVVDSPDEATFSGQRDRVLLMLLYNTGARVSELASLRVQDVSLESRMSVHVRGKGRKNRSVPLWRQTVKLLRAWLRRLDGAPDSPLLPNARGNPMTRSGIAQRLRLAVKRAASEHSAMRSARISPHTIRHTTAMHLLQSGVGQRTAHIPEVCITPERATSGETTRTAPPERVRRASGSPLLLGEEQRVRAQGERWRSALTLTLSQRARESPFGLSMDLVRT